MEKEPSFAIEVQGTYKCFFCLLRLFLVTILSAVSTSLGHSLSPPEMFRSRNVPVPCVCEKVTLVQCFFLLREKVSLVYFLKENVKIVFFFTRSLSR